MRHALRPLLLALLLGAAACAGAGEAETRAAIGKSLRFLTQRTLAWKEAHGCATCHHAPMTLWSCNEARKKGFAVDETAVKTIRDWVLNPDNSAGFFPSPETPPRERAAPLSGAYVLAALATGPPQQVDLAAVKRFREYFARAQEDDGSWLMGTHQGRPPLLAGDTITTRLVRLGLACFPHGIEGEASTPNVDVADAWLESPTPLKQGERALQILIDTKLGRPAVLVQPQAAALLAMQNQDGSWSQTPEMAGDAFATGQALYALYNAGYSRSDPGLLRGVDFLLHTQDEAGAWPMISRPARGLPPGFEEKPPTNLEPIQCAAAGWATLGLLGSL